jgi:hypothetical protein
MGAAQRAAFLAWQPNGVRQLADEPSCADREVVKSLRTHPRNASFDVGFHEIIDDPGAGLGSLNANGSAVAVAEKEVLLAPPVPMSNWTTFKVILDIGGNSYSRRLPVLAQLQSALILSNAFQDLFSRSLINGTHALLADVDGSDVPALFEQLQQDDAAAQAMGTSIGAHWRRHFEGGGIVDVMTAQVLAYAAVLKIIDDR